MTDPAMIRYQERIRRAGAFKRAVMANQARRAETEREVALDKVRAAMRRVGFFDQANVPDGTIVPVSFPPNWWERLWSRIGNAWRGGPRESTRSTARA